MLPQYNTQTFSQIYPDFASFKKTFDEDFNSYAKDIITEDSLKTLFWLLYSRYSSNPITNYSVINFKAKIVAITFQKGPSWEKRLAIQNTIRSFTEEDLLSGAKTIFNRASHNETEPGTDTEEIMPYIESQDVSNMKRSKLDAYSYLQDILKTDVTEEFIRSYARLFSKFVSPTVTRIYENDIVEEEEDEDNE